MSISPLSDFPTGRPPRCVSSGCHNSPAAEPALDADPPIARPLEDVFRTESRKLLRYLKRRVGDEAAPDIVQEVFMRAAGSQQRDRLVNPIGFIRRVTRNLLIDRARRRSANAVTLFPFDDQRDIAVAPAQEEGLIANDLMATYERAVEQMPEKTRRVFLMHRVDELSYVEIHHRLGISVATVEYHIMRALAHLREALDGER